MIAFSSAPKEEEGLYVRSRHQKAHTPVYALQAHAYKGILDATKRGKASLKRAVASSTSAWVF